MDGDNISDHSFSLAGLVLLSTKRQQAPQQREVQERFSPQSCLRSSLSNRDLALMRGRPQGISSSAFYVPTPNLQRLGFLLVLTHACIEQKSLYVAQRAFPQAFAVSVSTQDLIVFFCCFGVALVAVNIYRFSLPTND